ncbi:MAG: hypothetical protein ACLFUH_06955 [Bacteroidales bacterium]
MNDKFRNISNEEFKIFVILALSGIFIFLFCGICGIIVLISENFNPLTKIILYILIGIIGWLLFNNIFKGLKKQNTQPSFQEDSELNNGGKS